MLHRSAPSVRVVGLASLSALLLMITGGVATAADHEAPPGPKVMPVVAADLLHGLPLLPKPQPVLATDLGALEELAPGVQIARGRCVVLAGTLNIDQGPTDGLEVLACLKDGKNHEALVRLDTTLGQLVKAACIAALGLADGQPAEESSGLPARGTPVSLTVRWQDASKHWVELAGSSLVRDRVVDLPYPALPFVYVGSRFQAVFTYGPDGKPQKRDVFMLDATRSVAVCFDEPDALLASPFPGAVFDQRFEAYSAICPPVGTPVQVVISAATLPLTLVQAPDGSLKHGDQVLDDAALTALLAATLAKPVLHAVGVVVTPATERQRDVATRARIMRAAAAAGVWAAPVFVLTP